MSEEMNPSIHVYSKLLIEYLQVYEKTQKTNQYKRAQMVQGMSPPIVN